MPRNPTEAFSEAFSVAVVTPGTNFRAASYRIPSGVSPLNCTVVSHDPPLGGWLLQYFQPAGHWTVGRSARASEAERRLELILVEAAPARRAAAFRTYHVPPQVSDVSIGGGFI